MESKLLVSARLAFAVVLALLPLASLKAEVVYVKYQGPVSLSGFECTYPRSSFVNRVCYRRDAQYAVVLLGNTFYGYCGVPEAVIVVWLSAGSPGRFYNEQVRGRYRC